MQQDLRGRSLAVVCITAPEDAAWLDQWERHLRPFEQADLLSLVADRLQVFRHQCAAATLM